jgi:hypothetical protein
MILPAIGGEHAPGLPHGRQQVHMQPCMAHGPVEALPVPVRPRAPWVEGARPQLVLRQPTPHRQGHALRPMIATDELRRAIAGDPRLQERQHSRRRPRGGDLTGEPCPRELVHHRHPLQGGPLEPVILENVRGPDVARGRRRHGAARPMGRPPLACALADLPCRLLPEPRPGLPMHPLAATPAQRPHPPVAIAGMPARPLVDLGRECRLAIGTRALAERRALHRQ